MLLRAKTNAKLHEIIHFWNAYDITVVPGENQQSHEMGHDFISVLSSADPNLYSQEIQQIHETTKKHFLLFLTEQYRRKKHF